MYLDGLCVTVPHTVQMGQMKRSAHIVNQYVNKLHRLHEPMTFCILIILSRLPLIKTVRQLGSTLVALCPVIVSLLKLCVFLFLSHNNLTHILRSSLEGLFNLQCINLHFNPIQTLDFMSFSSLAVIDYVDLSELTISVIKTKALYGMQHCRQLNLSYNMIAEIPTGAFLGLPHLKVLDLRGNPIITFSPADFITIRMLPVVYMPVSEFCCEGTFLGSCYPTSTTTLRCYQYIESRVLKILGWCMVGLIGLTEGLMIVWHSCSKRKSLLPTIILKYSVEMLMGLSIAIILFMDLFFSNFFVALYLKVLTTGPMCLSANFLYIFSFEMSAFSSLVLVICKTLAVISPLRAKLLLTQTRLYLSALSCIICVISSPE